MIGLVTTDTSLQVWPRLRAEYVGGRDEIVSGPRWGWRTRAIQFTFRISPIQGTGRRLGAVGRLNLRRPIEQIIARTGLPPGMRMTVKQSPVSHLGISSRTVTVVFSATAPWEQPLPTGRELWESTSLNIPRLGALIARVSEGALHR